MIGFGSRLNERFVNEITTINLLDVVVDWIRSELEPEDVFPVEQLDTWAANNRFVRETE